MEASKLTISLTEDQQKQFREATGETVTELTLEPAPASELSDQQLDHVVGGLAFTFKLVAVKTISWATDESSSSATSSSGTP